MASITASALAGSGLPGWRWTFALVAISASLAGEKRGIAHQLQGMGADLAAANASKAASATSGPMPDGSPMVIRMG